MLVPTTIHDFCKPLLIYGINGNLDVMNYLRKYFFARKFLSETMSWARKCILHAHIESDDRELK
jgi:hypothetical protein